VIYDRPQPTERIDQGDLIDGCPLSSVIRYAPGGAVPVEAEHVFSRVVVLTQTCDLEQAKTEAAVGAVVEDAEALVARGAIKAAEVRGSLLKLRIYGLYFLPADPALGLPEMVADFRRLHTVRLDLLTGRCRAGQRRGRVRPLYREHLSKHFADGYSRIGLPQPVASA
jgi:hypothetical protein